MIKILFFFALALGLMSCRVGKHVFILSGQSNMVGLKPEESFTPMLEQALGKNKVLIVKDALGTQPIRRWYKNWKPLEGDTPAAQPDLYDSLMHKVYTALGHTRILSATFIWMQGERDAREKLGNVYARSLLGLHQQLQDDLKVRHLNFVIGRLNDFDMQNEKYPDWTIVREAQVQVAESNPYFTWVNTDDLNDGVNRSGQAIQNDLHLSAQGYITLGERFAQAAIQLIKKR